MHNKGIFAAVIIILLMFYSLIMYSLLRDIEHLQEQMIRVEYASQSSFGGVFSQLEKMEEKINSYEDAMEAIALVLERNTGYFLYQELGVVVMSHDEYLRRGGD